MVNFQEILSIIGVEYENLHIKSKKLQITYFTIKNILQIPIICLFTIVSTSLFSNIQFTNNILNFFQNQNQQTIQIQRITLLICVIIILVLIGLHIKRKNKFIKNSFYVILTFSQPFNKLGTFFLLNNVFNTEQFILIKIISVLVFILNQIPLILRDRIFISLEGNKTNILSHNPDPRIFFLNIFQKVLFYSIIVALKIYSTQQSLKITFYSLLFTIYLFKIVIYFNQKYYIDQLSNKLEIIGCILSLTLLLINEVYQITAEVLIIQNLNYLAFTVFFLGSLSVFSYYQYKQSQLLFISLPQIIQTDQVKKYLETIFKLWRYQKSSFYQSIIFSFKKNHQSQCLKSDCQCKQHKQNNQANNDINKGIKSNNKKQEKQNMRQQDNKYIQSEYFLRFYLKQNLKNLYLQIKNNNYKILILMIWLELFDQYIQINKKLHSLQNQIQKDYQTCIQIQILKNKVKTIIQKRNGYNNTVNIIQILNLQENITAMEDIILEDIQIKSSKWKYLCQNICKSIDIQGSIIKEISNIIEFDKIYSNSKVSYKRSVAFNCLSLFYYNEIVFLQQQYENIILNLAQLSRNVKQSLMSHQKQIQKKIFNQNCCLIEFDIVSNSLGSKQFQLILKNCNKNALKVFNSNSKQKLISKGFDKLFPQFLAEQYQQKIFSSFNSKKDLNRVQTYYLLDCYGFVFQALMSVKIIARNNRISCVFIILQKKSNKLILLNKKGCLQNIGRSYVNLFGNQYKHIPISLLFYYAEECNSLKFRQIQNKGNFYLFNGKIFKNRWEKYVQNVTQYLRKQRITTVLKINNSRDDLTIGNASKRLFQIFLKRQKKQLLENQIKQKNSAKSIDSRQLDQDLINDYFVIALLKYKKVYLNEQVFYVIILDEVKKNKKNLQSKFSLDNNDDIHRFKDQNIKNFSDFQSSFQKLRYNIQHQIMSQSQNQFQGQDQNDLLLQDQENQKLRKTQQRFIMETSSINSSLKTQNILNANSKFIQTCIKLFKNPTQINDKTLNIFICNSLIISMIIAGLILGSYIIFTLLLYEVKDIFFADGAVSDNMQLTQFMFNRALNYKIFRNDTSVLQNLQISSQFQRQYVYSLINYDYQMYHQQITSMTKTKFYEYLRIPVIWKPSLNNSIQIDSGQFLIFYYHLSRTVQFNIFQPTQQSQILIKNALLLMKINFPEMQRINHYNLNFYKGMSDQSLELFKKLIFIVFVVHLGLSGIFFLVFYRQKMFRRTQQIQGYSIYKIIPKNIVSLIGKYYQNHQFSCGNRNDLRKYQTYFQSESFLIPKQMKSIRSSNKSIFLTNEFSVPSIIWKVLAIIFLFNLVFGIIILKINNLINPIQLMMQNVNDLMDSQNYLIQAHINIKSNFIIQEQMRTDIQYINFIMSSQVRNDVLFNRIAVNSLQLFSQYESTYTSDFIKLLVQDVCQIAKSSFTQQVYTKCKKFFKLNMNQNGVITGMNFFTRKVRQTYQLIKKQIQNLKGQPITKQMVDKYISIFKSQDYRQIDQSMFYMFKLYQITQARIYQSLERTIVNHLNPLLIFAIIEIIFLEVIYTILLYFHFKKQKVQLSKLYISFLLIPSPIIKHVKDFSRKIEEILIFEDFK